MRHSNSKNLPYYFNAEQTISRWEPPEGTDTEKLKVYMANHHQPAAQRGSQQGNVAVPEGSIWAAHLLVKHNESRNPSSWKEVRARHPLSPASSRSRCPEHPPPSQHIERCADSAHSPGSPARKTRPAPSSRTTSAGSRPARRRSAASPSVSPIATAPTSSAT